MVKWNQHSHIENHTNEILYAKARNYNNKPFSIHENFTMNIERFACFHCTKSFAYCVRSSGFYFSRGKERWESFETFDVVFFVFNRIHLYSWMIVWHKNIAAHSRYLAFSPRWMNVLLCVCIMFVIRNRQYIKWVNQRENRGWYIYI